MEYKFIYQDKPHSVKIEQMGTSNIASVDGKEEIKVECIKLETNTLSLTVEDKVLTAYIAGDKGKIFVFIDGSIFTFESEKTESQQARDISVKPIGNTVVSSMPGSLVKLLVSIGSKVKAGETVAIVEAMKMENELKSPIDGIVKKINFKEGDQVDTFIPIVELEQSDEEFKG